MGVRPVKQPGFYFSHPACLEHDPRAYMPGHPDAPERLIAIEQALAREGWLGWERREAPPAPETQLQLVHSVRHVEQIRELSLVVAARLTRIREPPTGQHCTLPAARAR